MRWKSQCDDLCHLSSRLFFVNTQCFNMISFLFTKDGLLYLQLSTEASVLSI